MKAPTENKANTVSWSDPYSPTKAMNTKAVIQILKPMATIFFLPTLSEMNPKKNWKIPLGKE